MLEQYSYDNYGIPTVYTAAGTVLAGGTQYDNRYLFKSSGGYEWFAQAQLYYCRARFYLPQHGRFLQTDPIGQAGGLNIYAYCHNDPVNLMDPKGCNWFSDFLGKIVKSFGWGNSGGSSSSGGSTPNPRNGGVIEGPQPGDAERVVVNGTPVYPDYRIPLGGDWRQLSNDVYAYRSSMALELGGTAERTKWWEQGLREPDIDPTSLITGAIAQGLARSVAKKATTTIYRAVMDAELADIEATGALNNPMGVEVKYFSTTAEGASSYAQQAFGSFGDTSPYTIVSAEAPSSLATSFGTVDGGIHALVILTESLGQLGGLQILNYAPIH